MRSCALLAIGLGRYVLQKLEMDSEYEGDVEAKGKGYLTKLTDIRGRS